MIFDIIVLLAILVSAAIAFLRGFIREMLTIVGVVGGAAAAFLGGPLLLPLINDWLGVTKNPDHKLFDAIPASIAASLAAYGLIFVVVVIVLSVISYFLSSGAKALGLGPVDRALGVMFGIVRAVLLLCLLYLPVSLLSNDKERAGWTIFKGSQTRYYLEKGAGMITGMMPGKAHAAVNDQAKAAQDKIRAARQDLDRADTLQDAAGKATDKAEAAFGRAREKIGAAKENMQSDDKAGYKHDQRDQMDQLIEKNQ